MAAQPESTRPGRLPRVALLLDGWVQPRWIRYVAQEIQARRLGEIVAVVANTLAVAPQPRRSLVARVASRVRNATYLPYDLYSRFDRRVYRPDPDPFEPTDLKELLSAAVVVPVTPRQTAFSDYFEERDVDRLTGLNLDVALRFGFRILRGRALSIASQGVWSFHHGDNRESRGGPPCFWEVFEGRDATGAILQVLSEDLDAGKVLGRVHVPTHTLSVAQTAARLYWRAIPALFDALARLQSGAVDVAQPNMSVGEWQPYSRPLYTRPRAGSMLRLAGRLLTRRIRAAWNGLAGREQWRLMLHVDRACESDVPNGTPFRFRHLAPPADRYWADPCPVWHDQRHFVFFEDHPFASANAHISVVEIDQRGNCVGEPVVALRRDYHLSYPFVFQWSGTWYLVPESYTRGAIELFRCVRFPDTWEFAGNLLDGVAAVDPTIALMHGRWWLFAAAVSEGTGAADTLLLFSADSPLGPWTPHAQNPVKVDLRSARPAGRPFQINGTWYRPAQDGIPTYGTRIVFNRIDEITPQTFRETAVDSLDPSWDDYVLGTHTINCARGLTAIDARYRSKHGRTGAP